MLHLEITAGARIRGTLTYSNSDQSFEFSAHGEPSGSPGGTTSLVLDTLQLETDVDTGRVLYPWGFLPRTSWQSRDLRLPSAEDGVCTAHLDGDELVPGVSERISSPAWNVEFDAVKRMLRVGSPLGGAERLTRIADGVYVGVHLGNLRELWLVPEWVD